MAKQASTNADVEVAPAPAKEKPGKKNRPKHPRPKPKPPYAVILHNDDLHTFEYVVEVLIKVLRCTTEKAILLTTTAHTEGRAIVWSGPLEVAELKRDQIRGAGPDHYASKPVRFPLGVTIEQLPG